MADRRLQVFHAVAHHRSFTRAAEALYMTQPAVSFQVRQLEDQYNTRLLERSAGKVTLTPAGEIVLDYAERIIGLAGEMEQRIAELAGEMRGLFVLGASRSVAESALPGLVGEFAARHPGIRMSLIVDDAESIREALVGHRLDAAVLGVPIARPGLGEEAIGRQELVVVCHVRHPLVAFEVLQPEQLAGQAQVSGGSGSTIRSLCDGYLRGNGVDPEAVPTVGEFGSIAAQLGAVAAGLGFAVVPRGLAAAVRVGDGRGGSPLRELPLRPSLTRELRLVHVQGRFRTRVFSAFADHARRWLARPER